MPVIPPIEAILTANITEYQVAMREAVATADKTMLGISSSTVSANTSYRSLQIAALNLAKAEEQLAIIQADGTASADALAAAEERVAVAGLRMASATDRAAQAQLTLMVREAEAVAAADKAAAAQAAVIAKQEAAIASSGRLAGAMGLLTKIGKGVTLVTALIGYESVKMSAQFEASMLRIHTQAQVPMKDIPALSAKVLQLSQTIGQAPLDMSAALYHIASAFESTGISATEMGTMLEAAAKLAKIGGADVVSTTNAMTAIMAKLPPTVKNASDAIGVMNAIVGSGDMTMQQFNQTLANGAFSVVQQYGLSIRDAGAALATFGDLNMRASTAGTYLRMSVQALAVPAVTSTKLLKSIGLEYDSMRKDMQKGGLAFALDDFVKHAHAAGYTAKTIGPLITAVFTKRAGAGVSVLIDNLDKLKSKYPAIEAGAKGVGDAWKKTAQTTQQKIDAMKASFSTLAISIGEKLKPYLDWFLDKMTKTFEYIVSHKQILQDLTILIGSILVVAIGAAIVAFVAATWEIMAIGVAIAAIIFAFKVLWQTMQSLATRMAPLWRAMASAFETAWKAVVNFLSAAWSWMRSAWSAMGNFFVGVWRSVTGGIISGIASAASFVIRTIGSIRNAISSIGSGISSAVSGVGTLFGFAEGGVVPGPKGQAQLAVVHGGEYVLSNDMLKGIRKPPSGAMGSGGGSAGVADITVNVVLDGKVVHRAVQRQSLRYSINNPQLAVAGLAVPVGR